MGGVQAEPGLAPASPSAPLQRQFGRGADRAVYADTVHYHDPEPVCIETCDVKMGRCVAVEWLRPRNRQV
jgi:hypothetical protein